MTTTAARTVLEHCLIASFAIIAGFAAMLICEHERSPRLMNTHWPQAGLHAAAAAALEFKKDHGRLPYSLDELRSTQDGIYLPRKFDLQGVIYFRDGDGHPRLSWRGDVDHGAAYCSLDAALHEHC